MNRRTLVQVLVSVLAACIVAPTQAATTIGFDDAVAPSTFANTVALTEAYAGLGVHFAGPAEKDGGAILDQDSSFGLGALSGRNFLAFNRQSGFSGGGVPQDPETILFDSLMATVSVYAAGGRTTDTFTMMAYDAADVLVDTDTITTLEWGLLSVSSPGGIRRVVLTQSGDHAFIYDDLSFTGLTPAIPAPGAILLGTLGTSLVGWLRRRRVV